MQNKYNKLYLNINILKKLGMEHWQLFI